MNAILDFLLSDAFADVAWRIARELAELGSTFLGEVK